jgi:CRISPR-associated endonuclease/helicase Cas3
MGNGQLNFSAAFETLTGNPPFPWQREWHDHLAAGEFEKIKTCNLPTGLGKTSVIALWLIALANDQKSVVPRRLVYVVNRRTVVDQSSDEAKRLRDNLNSKPELKPIKDRLGSLGISTLRGQFADNREWSTDPSKSAIIVGTVDMIGSRLLFSGYGCGFKSKPLHAGFLGQDVLLVHDEAHLEPAFQKLLIAIEKEQHEGERTGNLPWPKMRVMELSATSRRDGRDGKNDKPFGLTDTERMPPTDVPDLPTEPIHYVWRRLTAKKGLKFVPERRDAIAKKIGELARKHRFTGQPILVFVRTIADVKTVQQELTKKKKDGPPEDREGIPEEQIQVLTGTLRGLERDRMATEDQVFARFFPIPKVTPKPGTVYLICTSAGEVGVDISGNNLVCDLTTLDSMAQRLGRVNRRGDGIAVVDVVYESDPDPKKKDDDFEKARWKTKEVLERLPNCNWPGGEERAKDRQEASPLELGKLNLSDEEQKAAFASEPPMPDTTNILFDAWSMTSIIDSMPGRPEVAPYLHGIADELPQTTIAWRAELDLLADNPASQKKLQAIFAKHRILPHETVTTNSYRVIKFFETITKERKALRDTRIAILFSRQLILTTVGKLTGNPDPLNADPTLILPASFGYLDDKGMLSADAIPPEPEPDETSPPRHALDIADHDGYESTPGAAPRLRVLIERTEEGWKASRFPGGKPLPDSINLKPIYERSTELIKDLQKNDTGLRVRLVQPIAFDDEGEVLKSLLALAPMRQKPPQEEQLLSDHVQAVEAATKAIAGKLKLPEPFRSALLFAAKWHDEGKKAPIWQRYIGGANGQPPLGKSAKWCDPKKLSGYRHEFGSLLCIEHPSQHQTACVLPDDPDAKDLALHLIAAHHGHARPHFSHTFDKDFTTPQRDQTHIDAIRRFARLQRKYGRWGLAYLESLLRAADWAASHGLETDDDTEELNEGDA